MRNNYGIVFPEEWNLLTRCPSVQDQKRAIYSSKFFSLILLSFLYLHILYLHMYLPTWYICKYNLVEASKKLFHQRVPLFWLRDGSTKLITHLKKSVSLKNNLLIRNYIHLKYKIWWVLTVTYTSEPLPLLGYRTFISSPKDSSGSFIIHPSLSSKLQAMLSLLFVTAD